MKNFILIGVAGYIAPRHLKAIKETGNTLLAALDKNDSVGILDNYFPDCDFFTEFERLDRHCEKLKRNGTTIDYVVVCTPNYLHDAHIRFGLRIGADVICEKPVVLNPWNVEALIQIEEETKKKVFTILQLRLHSAIQKLKTEISKNEFEDIYSIKLEYITARGGWYTISWKGDLSKSGGITTNIGVHFFDMLLWIFGDVKKSIVHTHTSKKASGELYFEKATVQWFLSIDANDLPAPTQQKAKSTYRKLEINNEAFDFSEGVDDLHLLSYNKILTGQGYTLKDCYQTIDLLHSIRNAVA